METEKEIIIRATDKANKRELSLKEAEDIVEKYPESHRAHALLAFLNLQNRDFDKVIERINESLKYGKSVTAHNLSAQANIELKNFKEAKTDYQKAFELDANDIATLINYSVFMGAQGEFIESIKTMKRLTLAQPNELSFKVKLVSMYHAISKFEEASKYLEGVVKEFPNEYILQHMLGNSYYQSGKKDESVKCFEKAISVKPDATRSYYNLAFYYYEIGNYSEAITLLEKVIEIDPDWKSSYILLCTIFYMQNEFSYFKEFYLKHSDILKTSIEIAALAELVSVQEGKENVHPFCPNPMNYISEFHIKDYLKDHENFIERLKKEIDTFEFHDGYAPHSSKSLNNGDQTIGNIFIKESNLIFELRSFFLAAIRDYREKHQSSEDLIINAFPEDIKLNGFSTKFDKGSGHHSTHYHPTGWISGSFYLNMPNDIKSHEGNIQFEVQGTLPLFNKKVKIEKRNIIPEAGKLIIFPSSLYHCTTPFLSKTSYRQALNFDLVSPYISNRDLGI